MVKSNHVTMSHVAEMEAAYQVGGVRDMALLHMFPEHCKSTICSYATRDFNANEQINN